MQGADDPGERLRATALALELATRELHLVVGTLRRAADAEALRSVAQGRRPEIGAAHVRSIILARAMRREYLDLPCGDPAWSLMLELLAAELEGRRATMTAVGEAAGLRATTALRWVKWLEEQAVVRRMNDPEDQRRVYLRLTDEASDSMRAYLIAALSRSPWLL